MGEYSLEQSLCLSQLLPSPKSYGQPKKNTQRSSQPIMILDERFVKAGTLEDESEDKAILNWLYKEEEASTSANISMEKERLS